MSEGTIKKISAKKHTKKVFLSGGVFQNIYLSSRIEDMLTISGFEVYAHSLVPTNDSGIALGQLAVFLGRKDICA